MGSQSGGAIIDSPIATAEDRSVMLRNLTSPAVVDLANDDRDEGIELDDLADDYDAVTVEADPCGTVQLQNDEMVELTIEVEERSPSFLTRVTTPWSRSTKYERRLNLGCLAIFLTSTLGFVSTFWWLIDADVLSKLFIDD